MKTIEDLVGFQQDLKENLSEKQLSYWESFYKQEPSYKHIEGSAYYGLMREKYKRVFQKCLLVK